MEMGYPARNFNSLAAHSSPWTKADTFYRKKAATEEIPDFFKVRDSDGSAVLCHQCQTSATDVRAIIPCSLCSLYWHLDCLEPPLLIPPVLRTWRCPSHPDDLLATLPGELAPAHRFRKIKGVPEIPQAYGRGMRNNGFINVDDSADPPIDQTGWNNVQSFGRVVRVPAQGIRLDTIEK
jgi:hypothetical protein